MAEFDPTTPKDAAETAYAQALLGDDAGREQRHARLMAALPRPEVTVATSVSDSSLAWRWQPYALGVVLTGLLLATALVLKGRGVEPRREPDPRLAAAQPASEAAVVVAQADAKVEAPPAPVAEAARVATKASPAGPRAERPAPIVIADATPPRVQREAEAKVAAAEPVSPAIAPPPAAPAPAAPAPAAPVMAAAPPPAAPVMAASAPPKVVIEASRAADAQQRSEAVSGGILARERLAAAPMAQSLAASGAAEPLRAVLLSAVNRGDQAAARSALQSGASVHLRDAQGRTVLMVAARNGSREVVDLLLAAGARKADRDAQGWTAADHARDQGHDELAERLR